MAKIEVEFTLKNGDKVKTSNEQIIAQLKETGATYTEVGNAATASSQEQVAAQEAVAKTYQEVLAEYKANKQELFALAAQGQETSARYLELQASVSKTADALEDSRRGIKANQSSTDAFIGSLSGVAGGFAAAQGAIGLFGTESDKVQKSLLKVQSALALAQGVQQLKDAKESFLSLGTTVGKFLGIIKPVEAANKNVAVSANTAAVAETQMGNAGLVAGEKTATGSALAVAGINAFKAALVSTGILAIVVAIGYAVSLIGEAWKAEEEANKEALENGVKSLDDYGNKLNEINQNYISESSAVLEKEIAQAEKNFVNKKGLEDEIFRLKINYQTILKKFFEDDEKFQARLTEDKIAAQQRIIDSLKLEGAERSEIAKVEAKIEEIRSADQSRKAKAQSDLNVLEFKTQTLREQNETRLLELAKKAAEERKVLLEKDLLNNKNARDKELESAKQSYEKDKKEYESHNVDLVNLTAEYNKRKAEINKKYDDEISNFNIAVQEERIKLLNGEATAQLVIQDRTGEERLAKLDKLQKDELESYKTAGKDTADLIIKQGIDRAMLENLISLQNADLRKKIQLDATKSILELENKAITDNIDKKVELYLLDFDAWAENEKKKAALAKDFNEAEYDEYVKLLRAKGEADLRYNDEVVKIEKQGSINKSSVSQEYYKELKKLQDASGGDYKKYTEDKEKLDKQYAIDSLKIENDKLDKEIALLEKDPNRDPVKLAELKTLRLKNETEIAEGIIALEKKVTDAGKTEAQKRYDNTVKLIQQVMATLSEVANAIDEFYALQEAKTNSFYDNEIQKNTDARDAEVNNYALTSEEKQNISDEYALKETALEEQRNEELKKIRKKQADFDFGIQLAQIAGNTALGIMQINANPAVNADVTQTLRVILTGLIVAAGIAQVAAATAAREQVKNLGKGGILDGPSHAAGGIMVGNTGISVEGGEAVINKRSTAMYAPLLSAINVAGGGNPLTPNFGGGMALGGQMMFDPNSITQAVQQGIQNGTNLTKAYILSSDVQSNAVKTSRIKRQTTY